MKFYKPLRPFKAISFDLDDTLYDNYPVIKKAEAAFFTYLTTTYSKLAPLTERQWHLYKLKIVQETPALKHDVTQWRQQTIQRIMVIYGIPPCDAIHYAAQAMHEFLRLRSDFSVPPASIELLQSLSQHYPVIAITNGNVDVKQIGLGQAFQFVLTAGNGFKSKPHIDLFQEAALQLDINISDILHVGDNMITDVYGAQQHQAQAVWFNPQKAALKKAKLLPCVEINDCQDLLKLLPNNH